MGRNLVFAVLVFSLAAFSFMAGCGESEESVTGGGESDRELITFYKLDPVATYLHVCMDPSDLTYDDGALDATPVNLSDYGIAAGDSILIEVVGEFYNGNNHRSRVIAVFSESELLLGKNEAHRVPGAIEAGEDYFTIPTYGCGEEPTDIPQDFYCTPDVSVTVPAAATHIFVCARDSYYEDNSDQDNDFGVRIYRFIE